MGSKHYDASPERLASGLWGAITGAVRDYEDWRTAPPAPRDQPRGGRAPRESSSREIQRMQQRAVKPPRESKARQIQRIKAKPAPRSRFAPANTPSPTRTRSGSSTPRRVVTRNGVRSSGGSSGGGGGFTGPRTFTDANNNVRRTAAWSAHRRAQGAAGGAGGGAGGGAAAAKDPLTQIVDDIIAGMNAPINEAKVQIDEQARGDVNQHDRLSEFYNKQLGSLQSNAQLDLGKALHRAAELKGISADTVAANQAWLMSLMGQSDGGAQATDTAASAQETSSDLAGVNDQIARELADGGQRLDSFLTSSRAAGHSARREFAEQQMLRAEAAKRELDRQIAANQAQAPALRRQIEAEEREFALKQAVAEREWGLKAAQFESLNNYRAGQLELQGQRLEQQAQQAASSNQPKPEKPGRYGNIPARYDKAIQSVYDSLNRPDNPNTEDVDESRVVRPWRTAFDELTRSAGLQPTTAALLATKWYPESITRSNAFNIITMLRNRGVSEGAQRRIVDQYFGSGTYTQIQRNPAAYLGSMAGDIL